MNVRANGLRYLRWGGDGEAVQPEKEKAWENAWDVRRIPASGARFVGWRFGELYLLLSLNTFEDSPYCKGYN